jgi:methionyl-tRNA synthetase
MLASNFEGRVPDDVLDAAGGLPPLSREVATRYDEQIRRLELSPALATLWELVAETNRYLVEKAPWRLAKEEGKAAELAGVLYASAEVLRILAILISPIMPGAASRLWSQLGIPEPLERQTLPSAVAWGRLQPGTVTSKGDALFPRMEG